MLYVHTDNLKNDGKHVNIFMIFLNTKFFTNTLCCSIKIKTNDLRQDLSGMTVKYPS